MMIDNGRRQEMTRTSADVCDKTASRPEADMARSPGDVAEVPVAAVRSCSKAAGPIRCSLSSKRAACEMYPLPLTFFALKTPKIVDRRRRPMHGGFPGAIARGNFLER